MNVTLLSLGIVLTMRDSIGILGGGGAQGARAPPKSFHLQYMCDFRIIEDSTVCCLPVESAPS